MTPVEGSRKARLVTSYLVGDNPTNNQVYGSDGTQINISTIKSGDRIRIYYIGLEYDKPIGEISWYNRI